MIHLLAPLIGLAAVACSAPRIDIDQDASGAEARAERDAAPKPVLNTLRCGNNTCEPAETDLGRLNACCIEGAQCGILLAPPIGAGGCARAKQAPLPGSCPPVELVTLSATGSGSAPPFVSDGCCLESGLCGVVADEVWGIRLGLGCLDPHALGESLGSDLVPCNSNPDDAGSSPDSRSE